MTTPLVTAPARSRALDAWALMLQLVRWLAFGWVVLGIVVGVALTPRTARYDELRADLDAGRVSAIWTDSGYDGGGLFHNSPNAASRLLWASGGPVAHYVKLGDGDLAQYLSRTGDASAAAPLADAAASLAREADVTPRMTPPRWTAGWFGTQWRIVAVCSILLMLVLPQPRRATRWGWFWLLGLPFGVGVLWWLLREAPWSATATRIPQPAAHAKLTPDDRKRRSGWDAFFTSLLITLAATVMMALPMIWLGG